MIILSNSIDEAREGYGDVIQVTRYLDIRLSPEKAFNASGEFLPPEYVLDRINKRKHMIITICDTTGL